MRLPAKKDNEAEMPKLEWCNLGQARDLIVSDLPPISDEDLRRSTNPKRSVAVTPESIQQYKDAMEALEQKLKSGELTAWGIEAVGEVPLDVAVDKFPMSPSAEVAYLKPENDTGQVKIPVSAWKNARISYAYSAAVIDKTNNYIDIKIKTDELCFEFPMEDEAKLGIKKRRDNEVLRLLYYEGKEISKNNNLHPTQPQMAKRIFEKLPESLKKNPTTIARDISDLLKKRSLTYTKFRDSYVRNEEFKKMTPAEWMSLGEK